MGRHIFFLLLVILPHVFGARILGIFHMSARSHYILGSSLMIELAKKGHDVTVISPFSENTPPKGGGSYRDIVLTGFVEEHDRLIKQLNFFKKKMIPMAVMAPLMGKMFVDMTEKVLNHTNVQNLIHSGETFDVVITEEFLSHALKGLSTHFKGHLITLSPMGASTWTNDVVGNPTPLSYASDFMLAYPAYMSFCERLINTINYVTKQVVNHLYLNSKHDQLIKKYIPNGPNLEDVLYNVSLILVNSHPSTNLAVPYVPQMVDIGGYHVKASKELPKDLQEYLDNAKDGVIYFSLGSNIKSALLPREKREAFLQTFAKLKEQVLWKWEEDDLPDKPSNVRTAKWLPQQDILAHPNVKLFITHAGLLSTIETTYLGMPVLAVPLGGDQTLNAQQMVNQGIGLQLSFHDVSQETLLEALNKLLNEPRFRENARARSQFFHDRPSKPIDTAIYWIEYVIRHGGTSHLRVAGLDLPWYQYLLLDVIAVIIITLIATFYICYKMVQKIVLICLKKKALKLKKQ